MTCASIDQQTPFEHPVNTKAIDTYLSEFIGYSDSTATLDISKD